ncbi:MAG: 5-formyltetrahydrofolate cyclo-ligase [Paludibacteraceae bacterium]|nr:5-formyltetrahydrofolate cyclo-ligase [Paludibacteraceae bacterium]
MLFESNIKDLLSLLPQCRLHRAKQRMRELLIQKRRMLSAEERTAQSELILSQLEKMTVFREAKTVLLYYPKNNEVDVLPLFKRYKRDKVLLLPVTHRNGMTANPYEGNDKMHRGKVGIPEPTTPPFEGNIDVIIVPAVAFDKQGNRLGRGGGYYDRFLKKQTHATIIGVGYDFQLVDEVPVRKHDQKMHRIILPSQTIQV